jgi:hypothetical protein
VPRGQHDGSLRPYSRFSRQVPLLFYQVVFQLYSLQSATSSLYIWFQFLNLLMIEWPKSAKYIDYKEKRVSSSIISCLQKDLWAYETGNCFNDWN